MSNKYRPIDCEAHDRLLDYATRGVLCFIEFMDEKGEKQALNDSILDVYAESGSEYMKLGGGGIVRLDRLLSVNGRKVQ